MKNIVLLFILITIPFISLAETIKLRSGKTIEASVTEKSEEYIVIDMQGVSLTYYFDEIESIDGIKPGLQSSKSISQIIQDQSESIVYIAAGSPETGYTSTGSGFVVDSRGVIATSFHVISSATQATVKLKDGRVFNVDSVAGYDFWRDVCLLRIDAKNLRSVQLGNSDNVRLGEQIIVIGNPMGLEHTIAKGLVTSIRESAYIKQIQIDAPISPGSSGSPVFNMRGQVIGVVASSMIEGQLLNFSVPINYVRELIDDESQMTLKQVTTKLSKAYEHFDLAKKYLSQGQTAKVITEIEKISRMYPVTALTHVQLGTFYDMAELYDEAAKEYKKAIAIDPNEAAAYSQLGWDCIILDRLDEAKEAFNKTLAIDSKFALAHVGLGNVYYKKRLYENSIQEFRNALSLDPATSQAYVGLGTIYLERGDYSKAIEELKKAILFYPNNAGLHYQLGLAHAKSGNRSMAEEEFKILQKLDQGLANELMSQIR